ncbi:MAG: hypothetical protein A2Y62_10780 [Candidatus Fischerbacteria bacterium RBG_13_37_8]|uniref:Bacterial surface antigen (D15) domain-containing protein n=1 Tax=Candidatus Fischerbacteria bacterium RBG_13_37_8 TaxID=1817863 RepID=A0A1F5VUM5_9BACT|nr:MAG: hypothetical protein A2Y62_10780 [Candidatus Fischerbacteria bacterium RBG_13_37_8]
MTTNKVTRLTYGLRAKDPDFANEDIIFVLNESYNSSIHSLPRNKIPCKEKHCHSRIIIQGEQGTQYSGPKWNEKKKLIAAAKWKINGIMSIIIFTKEGDIIDEIGGDTSRFLSPIWSSDGEYVLFSSDMDGIFNIYSYSLQNKKICKLTSEISGAFYPALLETELAYVRYAAHGYQIASIPLTKNIATCNTPIEMNTPGKITNVNTQKNTYPVSNYSAFSFLIPRYWTPIVFTKEKDIQLGIFTSSKDLLYHSYTLSLSYGYHSNKFMYEFHYNYDRFYPTLGISIKKDLNWYADNDYYSTKEVDLFAYFPFRHLTYQTYASMGISRENHYNHLPYSEKNFSFTWFSIVTGFNNAKKYPYSISPTDGRTIQVQFENALNKNEINGSLYKVQINWNEYIPFIFGHHVIAIKTAYGKSWGNSDFRLVYFMGGFDSDADLLPLRGYKKNVFAASEAAMSNLEYHAPLFNFERGKGNIPVFLQKLHISFFMDFAKARSFQNIWFTKKSYGIEASLDMTLAYELNASISAGYAKGIDAGGINQFYLYFSSDF